MPTFPSESGWRAWLLDQPRWLVDAAAAHERSRWPDYRDEPDDPKQWSTSFVEAVYHTLRKAKSA